MLAIDGKTLRRSFDRAVAAASPQFVTAFACDARLVIGQAAVPDGGNEITAARSLFGLLDLTGMLVTTAFDEDRARTRRDHGPENLATLRSLALNVLP